MSDQRKMKDLVIHKEGLEHEVERLEWKLGNATATTEALQERIEKEKAKIKVLEEQIEKEKGSPPKVYDPKSYVEAGRWNDASYGIPDLIKGSGYRKRVCGIAAQWLQRDTLSVWECEHPDAKRWCRITLIDKMHALKEEIAKTERMYAKYIE